MFEPGFFTVAVEACERNIRLNGKVAMAKLTAHHADSRIYMLSHEKEFDVVSTLSPDTMNWS
jgi:hypothetical protein